MVGNALSAHLPVLINIWRRGGRCIPLKGCLRQPWWWETSLSRSLSGLAGLASGWAKW